MQCDFIARRSCLGWPTSSSPRPSCWVEEILWSPVQTTIFWVGMPQQKETEKVCGPFFGWKQRKQVDWASIFGLQVEDTLHFCCFPSNIAIIQSSQSGNHFLSVSLLQIRNTSKDFGLGRWTSLFRPTKIRSRLRWLDSYQRVTILEARAIFTSHKVGPNEL